MNNYDFVQLPFHQFIEMAWMIVKFPSASGHSCTMKFEHSVTLLFRTKYGPELNISLSEQNLLYSLSANVNIAAVAKELIWFFRCNYSSVQCEETHGDVLNQGCAPGIHACGLWICFSLPGNIWVSLVFKSHCEFRHLLSTRNELNRFTSFS